ncbi:hypothetical protein, partial [Ensifer sp.]|uniref:hypothetical protein n=1 Tax=Ensifer sp. TaxID=1872086 RepID=UPI002E15713C|nr:hypothetical protein [Ensifer sp.]
VHKRGFSGLRGPKYREAAHRQSSPVAMTTGAERCDALTPFILGQLLRFPNGRRQIQAGRVSLC